MPTCFALFCIHDSRRESCRMFQFPSDPQLRKQWLNNTRRVDVQLKSSSRICSCHFVKGKKQYGPTLFAWTNYISKIRRDLETSNTGEFQEEASGTNNRRKLVDDDDDDDKKREKKCRSELHSSETDAEVEVNGDKKALSNGKSASHEVNIKEIESKVSNNHKLVNLRVENLILMHEIEDLRRKLNKCSDSESYQSERLTADKLMGNEALLHCYTGLTSSSVFKFLVYALSGSGPELKYTRWSVVSLRIEEQMLITLMKIRCNFGFIDIAYRFRISASTVKNIIWTFVDKLHSILYEESIVKKPFPHYSGSDGVPLPEEFKNFSNCRIILGTVEVEAEGSRVNISNDYKRRILKGLVGVSPFGVIIFASELFSENVTVKEMILKSNLFEKLSSGDLILSLENLCIEDILPVGIDLNVPLLTQNDVTLNGEKIVSDIERACQVLNKVIDRLRRYSILDRILLAYRMNASKLFQICCALVNLEDTDVELP